MAGRPRAVVVSMSEDTSELEELLYSLGYDVAHRVLQRRGRGNPATFLGTGKVEELQGWLASQGVAVPRGRGAAGETLQRAERRGHVDREGPDRDRPGTPGGPAPPPEPPRLVAVDEHLKPSQLAGLERLLGVDVFDRVRVILEIFQQRAHTKEARLQVELARLRYERPLVREYIHLAKRGEHPGFMAGGGYAVDQYYDTINQRISRIQQELERIGREREERRKHRRRGGFHLVSLAGYTNAGKSSLLKRLSGEDVLVENRMFSTLETRTGRARAGGRDVLVTDTVGFVEGLPPELVKAFRSTLEEIAHADVIVLAVDASNAPAEVARKLRTSLRVLRDYEDLAPIVLALNKSDLVPAARRGAIEAQAEAAELPEGTALVWVSALRGEGLDDLVARVLDRIPPLVHVEASLPTSPEGEAIVGDLHDAAEVTSLARRGDRVELAFVAPGPVAGHWAKRIRKAGGEASVREPQVGRAEPGAPSPSDAPYSRPTRTRGSR